MSNLCWSVTIVLADRSFSVWFVVNNHSIWMCFNSFEKVRCQFMQPILCWMLELNFIITQGLYSSFSTLLSWFLVADDTWLSYLIPRNWDILIMDALLYVPENEEKQRTMRITISEPAPACTACTGPSCSTQESQNSEKKWIAKCITKQECLPPFLF